MHQLVTLELLHRVLEMLLIWCWMSLQGKCRTVGRRVGRQAYLLIPSVAVRPHMLNIAHSRGSLLVVPECGNALLGQVPS